MKPISQYATLKEFTTDIDSNGHHLPFKIMGKRRLPDPAKNFNGIYYTGSMLAEIHQNTPDPDQHSGFQSVTAPFGEILKVGCRLTGGSDTYSSKLIPNPKTGSNLLQGDILELDLSYDGKAFPKNSLAMITSHSCSLTNGEYISLIPVFLESALDSATIAFLRGGAAKNPVQVRASWLTNEQINFLGLPSVFITGSNAQSDRLLACLHMQVLVPKKYVPTMPKLRLTYRALSYFQLRIALLYLRDVQDSDDTREF